MQYVVYTYHQWHSNKLLAQRNRVRAGQHTRFQRGASGIRIRLSVDSFSRCPPIVCARPVPMGTWQLRRETKGELHLEYT